MIHIHLLYCLATNLFLILHPLTFFKTRPALYFHIITHIFITSTCKPAVSLCIPSCRPALPVAMVTKQDILDLLVACRTTTWMCVSLYNNNASVAFLECVFLHRCWMRDVTASYSWPHPHDYGSGCSLMEERSVVCVLVCSERSCSLK